MPVWIQQPYRRASAAYRSEVAGALLRRLDPEVARVHSEQFAGLTGSELARLTRATVSEAGWEAEDES